MELSQNNNPVAQYNPSERNLDAEALDPKDLIRFFEPNEASRTRIIRTAQYAHLIVLPRSMGHIIWLPREALAKRIYCVSYQLC